MVPSKHPQSNLAILVSYLQHSLIANLPCTLSESMEPLKGTWNFWTVVFWCPLRSRCDEAPQKPCSSRPNPASIESKMKDWPNVLCHPVQIVFWWGLKESFMNWWLVRMKDCCGGVCCIYHKKLRSAIIKGFFGSKTHLWRITIWLECAEEGHWNRWKARCRFVYRY